MRPFWVPTSTPQPVPQNRHGALSQRMGDGFPSGRGAGAAKLIPATAAAAAAACALMKSRREKVMQIAPQIGGHRRYTDTPWLRTERPGVDAAAEWYLQQGRP